MNNVADGAIEFHCRVLRSRQSRFEPDSANDMNVAYQSQQSVVSLGSIDAETLCSSTFDDCDGGIQEVVFCQRVKRNWLAFATCDALADVNR